MVGGDLDIEASNFSIALCPAPILTDYSGPEILVSPFVKIVKDIVVCGIRVSSRCEALCPTFFKKFVGECWYPLECGLPIASDGLAVNKVRS